LDTAALRLDPATSEDISFVMATERLPGYEELVGRWSEAQHRAALIDGRHAYFIARVQSNAVGFAIVRDWASTERASHIKRVAVCQPGCGHGRNVLIKLIEVIFRDTQAHRIWLGIFPENCRARRAYEAVGFQTEGLARGSAFFGGIYRDELVMSLLRPDWAARDQDLAGRERK
jgi:diamine N-acetyltransferase